MEGWRIDVGSPTDRDEAERRLRAVDTGPTGRGLLGVRMTED